MDPIATHAVCPFYQKITELSTREEGGLARGLALRALSGEEAWRTHVFSTLRNERLSAWERIEAVVYVAHPPGFEPDRHGLDSDALAKLVDESAALQIAAILPDAHGFPGAGRQKGMLASSVSGRAYSHPAMRDMLIKILRHDPDPRARSGVIQALAIRHGAHPAAAAALREARDSDPEARVRDWASEVLRAADH